MSSVDIKRALKRLTIANIVAISVDLGLSLSYADKRTRTALITKWNAQSPALRSLLLSEAKTRNEMSTSAGERGTEQLLTPAASAQPGQLAEGIHNIPVKALQLAMQDANVLKAKTLAGTRDGAATLFQSLSQSMQAKVLLRATTIWANGKRQREDEFTDVYCPPLGAEWGPGTSSVPTPFGPPPKRQKLDRVREIINGPFLKLLTTEDTTRRVLKFRLATGNDALARIVCSVCARRLAATLTCAVDVAAIPSPHMLRPHIPHATHTLHHGMLLYSPAVSNGRTNICQECLKALKRAETPSLSLANNMWLGDIPSVLSVLTLPERVLIARYFPAAYIVKLYPKNPAFRPDPRTLTSGLRGNVTTYPLDVLKLSQYMTSSLLPQPPQILAATIGVTFVGVNNVPEKTLRGLFSVSRLRVRLALQWLRLNNPLYTEIQVDEDRLAALPEDDVPSQLLQVVRVADDLALLEQERSGYVPNATSALQQGANRSDVEQAVTADDIDDFEDADIVPMQAHGMIDTEAASVSDSELLSAALANTAAKLANASDVQIKHGSAMINEYPRVKEGTGQRWTGGVDDPNHLLAAFPVLFPYGLGGFEVDRPKSVTYDRHIQWALLHADKRFRMDIQFIFQVFGVTLKRRIYNSAVVQVRRSAFQKHAGAIAKLKPVDFANASVEEANNRPFSNPVVQLFRGHLSALRSKVAGTDESRRAIRGQIWGCTLVNGPPSLWVTINPSDVNDPVAQVLAGQRIDLDNFMASQGPDKQTRAYNIAEDPFAASEFFHITIRALLKELLGITAVDLRGRAHIARERGVFGTVKAYIGTVEAQGRGMLHLHLLLWLNGSPTSQEMSDCLLEEDFREKVRLWVSANITADIGGLGADEIEELPHSSECSFSRPPDPEAPAYQEKCTEHIRYLARSLQLHACKGRGCLQKVKGELRCKRRAPYPCAASAWVSEAGEWGPQRTHSMVVAFNPTILLTVRCNHDVKLLTNAFDTRGIAWYITFYATKKQQKSGNSSAVLARRMAYHCAQEDKDKDVEDLNRRMINRCANALNREQEFSAPEVIGYLMGWGDRYISHHYVTIYWDSVVYGLKDAFAVLRNKAHKELSGDDDIEARGQELGEDRTCSLQPKGGHVMVKDQKMEYMLRGDALEDWCYWDFFLDTYEQNEASTSPSSAKKGIPYWPGGPPKAFRRVRQPGHEMLPQFVGQWFPSSRDEEQRELYCACILALFTPWRVVTDLKGQFDTFAEHFALFVETCPTDRLAIMDNMEYYYLSAEAAKIDKPTAQLGPAHRIADMDSDDAGLFAAMDASSTAIATGLSITDDDIEAERLAVYTSADRKFAQQAMAHAYNGHVFEDAITPGQPWTAISRVASNVDSGVFEAWSSRLKHYTRANDEEALGLAAITDTDICDVGSLTTLQAKHLPGVVVDDTVELSSGGLFSPKICLNAEQQRAYDIVNLHLLRSFTNGDGSQLLMIVNGPGGTGKSALIDAITDLMSSFGVGHWLAKTATSGVAATRIGGTTAHSWAGLGIATKAGMAQNASAKTLAKRKLNMQYTRYLLIDEFSMLTKGFLESLSEACCQTKCRIGNCNRAAFGGLNIIFFGDFHQFPPIIRKEALYYPDDARLGARVGRQLYELFTTVVTLTTQMRVRDQAWTAMLERLREGACTSADIRMVKGLDISADSCPTTDFSVAPWNDAVLVTSRNSVRDAWNTAALRRHSFSTGQLTYVCPAEDTIGKDRRPLSRLETLIAAGMAGKATGRLSFRTHVAIGMRGMVLLNIATESDLANGSRGTVVDIALDAREDELVVSEDGQVKLKYPPACVTFRLDHSTFPQFDGLGRNEIPLFPSETSYSLLLDDGRKKTVRRRQLAITPAYAFTDYKSQGQTIEHVVVDLAESTRNSMDPFHAYVALSRSRGRDSIRLLRDFDSRLLTTHPSVHLRPEDARLERLNVATARELLDHNGASSKTI